MEKPSEERQWQLDARAFWWNVLWHWEGLVTAICGCAAIAFWAGEEHVIPGLLFTILAIVSFIIACFRAWKDERRSKEKALAIIEDSNRVPSIAGTWVRFNEGLTMRIEQDGLKIKSTFIYDKIEHELEGDFDLEKRKFFTATDRRNTVLQTQTVMRASFALLADDKNLLAFVSLGTDGKGELPKDFPESGVYKREKGQ